MNIYTFLDLIYMIFAEGLVQLSDSDSFCSYRQEEKE